MILLSLGTHEQAFARAVELVAPLSAEETVLVQHGYTPPEPGRANVEWVRFLEPAALRRALSEASVSIVHGGVGSIMLALQAGRMPVVIPRLARFEEHVDNHQVEIAGRLAARGLLIAVLPGQSMQEAVEKARASAANPIGIGRALERALADEAAPGAPHASSRSRGRSFRGPRK